MDSEVQPEAELTLQNLEGRKFRVGGGPLVVTEVPASHSRWSCAGFVSSA